MANKKNQTLDTPDALLAALQSAAVKTVAVPVAELGGTVNVMRLTADEWLDPDASGTLPAEATPAQRRGWAIARWLCKANGERLVKPGDLAVIDLCAALPYEAAHRILSAVGVVDGAEPKNA